MPTHPPPVRHPGTESANSSGHVLVTVHGIRTYGRWQEKLESLVRNVEPDLIGFNYHYGWFSAIAFLVPFLRWIATRRFQRWFAEVLESHPDARVDVVAHSFGTHLAGWSLHRLAKRRPLRIHTVILAASVLRSSFPWDTLLRSGDVQRIVNECGTKDKVLLVNQLVALFMGMAGRVGFVGGTGEHFRNRYFLFGHSGYFRDTRGKLSREFMEQHWVRLLISEEPTPAIDHRPDNPSPMQGVLISLLNNSEPVKIIMYSLPFALLASLYHSLYREASYKAYLATLSGNEIRVRTGDLEGARESIDVMASPPETRFGRALESLGLMATWRDTWETHYLERVLDRSMDRGELEDAPEQTKGTHHDRLAGAHAVTHTDVGVFWDDATNLPLDSALVGLLPPGLSLFRHESSVVLVSSPDRRKVAAWLPTRLTVRSKDGLSFDVEGQWLQLADDDAALGFSADGRRLAVLGPIQEVWDVSNLGRVHRRRLDEVEDRFGAGKHVLFNPRSETLVYGLGESLYIWDVGTGELQFETNPSNPNPLPGDWVSHYVEQVHALAFDARGDTLFLAYDGISELGAEEQAEGGVDVFMVLAVGTRTSDGHWLFKERVLGVPLVSEFCAGSTDPERILFLGGSDTLHGIVYRDSSKTFQIPIATQPVIGRGCDVSLDRYVTVYGPGGTQTFDLRPVSDSDVLFAARQWGYSYPIPDGVLASLTDVEASSDGKGVFVYGSREDGIPVVLEHRLLDGGFAYYDTLGSDGDDLRMKPLEATEEWWVLDVQESPDRSRLFGFVVTSAGRPDQDENPYDWTSFAEGSAAFLVAWERTTGRQLAHWQLHPDRTADAPRARFVDAPSESRGTRSTLPRRGLILEDPSTGEELMRSLPRWPHVVPTVSPDGKRATFFAGPNLTVIDAENEQILLTLNRDLEVPLDELAWALDGGWLVGVGARPDGSMIQIWDTRLSENHDEE